MVRTRSQSASGSPIKPLAPSIEHKGKSNLHVNDSNNEESAMELDGIKKSLTNLLERIVEDDENIATAPDGGNETTERKPSAGRNFNHVQQQPRFLKIPLKIPDTITEEPGEDNTVEMEASKKKTEANKTIDNEPEQCAKKASCENQPSTSRPRSRFYFPPPKTLVPLTTVVETSIDVGMDMPETYIDVKGTKKGNKKIDKLHAETTVSAKDSRVKDSVITSDFERSLAPPGEKSLKRKWRERKSEREASAGKEWFNLKPPEMTAEVKRDLKILQMRSVLDPKRFYKHNDRKVLPKYFQIGKIMDNAADFYSSRVPKKQRKANLTEELLADAEFQRYQKRKYNEIQMQKKSQGKKKWQAKRRKVSNQDAVRSRHINTIK